MQQETEGKKPYIHRTFLTSDSKRNAKYECGNGVLTAVFFTDSCVKHNHSKFLEKGGFENVTAS